MSKHVYGTKFNPTDVQIKTWSVQRALDPLVIEVTSLISDQSSSTRKGRSKRAHLLVENVIQATENFMKKVGEIANENPDMRNDLLQSMKEVKRTGDEMVILSKEFADDPCSKVKREKMITAARALLTSVTHLLILADLVDVQSILKSIRLLEDDLQHIRDAANQEELNHFYQQYGKDINDLNHHAQRRQQDLIDRIEQESLAAARATLVRSSMMLFTAAKTYLRHPEIPSARENRDFVYNQICHAVNVISSISRGQYETSTYSSSLNTIGDLTRALNEFDNIIMMKPQKFNEQVIRPQLEGRLEDIISGAALLADSLSTRDDRRDRIVQECNSVRQALQELLDEYIKYSKKKSSDENVNEKVQSMQAKTRDLRRQLRKAVVDHVSDAFVATNVPLLALIDAARRGDPQLVEDAAQIFIEHTTKLIEVANVVCSMSDSVEGIKLVRLTTKQIENLTPQVVNAARILAARSTSKLALENMDVFRDTWERNVRLLTDAVDEITRIEDFLAISENHILEDINTCIQAMVERKPDRVDLTAGAIRGRSMRVIDVVTAEMEKYEPGEYTEAVMESVRILRDQIVPGFAERIQTAIDILRMKSGYDNRTYELSEQEIIEVSSSVYHAIRDIRNSVLMNPDLEWPSDDEEGLNDEIYAQSQTSSHGPSSDSQQIDLEMYPGKTDNPSRDMMRRLPKEEREQIEMQVEGFKKTKRDFEREVLKWDDRGNDIIVLAKKMCMIMMEMTDFTRGRGPLRTTMDVINAAKMISECGSKLNKLAKDVAAQCVESQSKSDLVAYVDRITLYCHQLDITSKVKADVQNISGELIVSGLDSATSLITAAKNLMNAVVLTVKASYIASTKYRNKSGNKEPIVQWKMRLPEKKPLVLFDRQNELDSRIRKGSAKTRLEPLHVLSQFQN
ncbi:unnamed protein product [Rotaria magnacalcarata]|uniref:Uncharacterized protein n=2 Tax=Rotaria magnacalcarata TaxID=392030 RepID=A0A816UNC3_9BILA|nr:unnamed protein product [Rotaria magnacalcarata]CAF2104134.1 unnamed protein product [Rotaria magnacalcarata]CAF2175657.1 unnamed protein product [Rotaria magnacalcarata]CAF3740374.1 unnamed protein product [Rotaria magnacalcarata]CAF3744114.1 unnamed protein product [Rotaria magnacalcarata]